MAVEYMNKKLLKGAWAALGQVSFPLLPVDLPKGISLLFSLRILSPEGRFLCQMFCHYF